MNLPTEYQSFIHLSRYARWRYDEERREKWSETIGRYFDFFKEDLKEKCDYDFSDEDRKELEEAVLNTYRISIIYTSFKICKMEV